MPNMAKVLKEEFVRLAGRVTRAGVRPVHRATVAAKHDIAALKRRVADLEKANRDLQAAVTKLSAAMPQPAPAAGEKARITGKGMRSLRRRLRLSRLAFGRLLGVSQQAVYAWERRSGGLKVRSATRAAILAARGLGARAAQAKLAQIEPGKKPAAKARRAKRRLADMAGVKNRDGEGNEGEFPHGHARRASARGKRRGPKRAR